MKKYFSNNLQNYELDVENLIVKGNNKVASTLAIFRAWHWIYSKYIIICLIIINVNIVLNTNIF